MYPVRAPGAVRRWPGSALLLAPTAAGAHTAGHGPKTPAAAPGPGLFSGTVGAGGRAVGAWVLKYTVHGSAGRPPTTPRAWRGRAQPPSSSMVLASTCARPSPPLTALSSAKPAAGMEGRRLAARQPPALTAQPPWGACNRASRDTATRRRRSLSAASASPPARRAAVCRCPGALRAEWRGSDGLFCPLRCVPAKVQA